MAIDSIDEFFLGNVERIRDVVPGMVERASTIGELDKIRNESAPEGFSLLEKSFKERLKADALQRIAIAKEVIKIALEDKAHQLKK